VNKEQKLKQFGNDALVAEVINNYKLDLDGIHGVDHWSRVLNNAIFYGGHIKDKQVLKLFALLHDSCRRNDDKDISHGARAAKYASDLRGKFFDLSDDDFMALHYAISCHNDGKTTKNPIVGLCWDADRLDLGRVYIKPHPKYISTDHIKDLLLTGEI